MELSGYLKAVRRRWWLPVLFGCLAFLGSLGWSLIAPSEPAVRSSLLLYVPEVQSGPAGSFLDQQVQTYLGLARSDAVLEAVIEDLGLDITPRELRRRLTVTDAGDGVVRFVYRMDDPAKGLNVVAGLSAKITERYQELLREPSQGVTQEIDAEIAETEQKLAEADQAIADFVTAQGGAPEGAVPASAQDVVFRTLDTKRRVVEGRLDNLVTQLGEARLAELEAVGRVQIQVLGTPQEVSQSSRRQLLTTVMAGVLGAALGAFLAVLLGVYGRGISSLDEVEALTGSVVLGVIPVFDSSVEVADRMRHEARQPDGDDSPGEPRDAAGRHEEKAGAGG